MFSVFQLRGTPLYPTVVLKNAELKVKFSAPFQYPLPKGLYVHSGFDFIYKLLNIVHAV